MKRKNSSDTAYDSAKFIADFMECECFNGYGTKNEYDKSIEDINAMINYCIDSGNEEEVKSWRKLLQQTRVEKRRAKMIERKNAKEFALT